MINNKGMTLVELLVTFSLLLVIVVGMFNLIMDVKFELDEKQKAKDLTEYSATINNDIHYDLLSRSKKFGSIALKSSADVDWICEGKCGVDLTKLGVNLSNSDNKFTKACEGIYPCAVYTWYDVEDSWNSTVIALNYANSNISDDNTASERELLGKHGIYYNGVFESVPQQDYLEIAEDSVNMSLSNDGLFVINYPLYLVDHDKNYGFKIVYKIKE